MSLLIRNVLLEGEYLDVYIEKDRFTRIAPVIRVPADTVIDGTPFTILPAFYNTHTHAAMSLMRGYADDMELFTWLNEHIWPLEKKITEDDVYHGTRLAILEMIKSGTVYFNDMYWHPMGTARAAAEMGIRADIAPVIIDPDGELGEVAKCDADIFSREREFPPRVRFVLGPHAIYTDSKSTLKSCSELAREQGKRVQIHVSETAAEVEDCVKAHGMRPVEYLDSIGFWGPEVLAVHAVHLNDRERDILREHEVSIAHCPASNMKLCSGNFGYVKAAEAGIRLTLGTDGASSNNDLSMLEEMKLAALWAKSLSGDPTAASAEDIFRMATRNGAEWAGLDAGEIREGRLADCILLRRDHHTVAPSDHFISDLVYSADNESIDTVICGGNILMRDRAVKGENEIVARAKETYGDLLKR